MFVVYVVLAETYWGSLDRLVLVLVASYLAVALVGWL